MKKFHPDKLKPKSEKCAFIGYPKETVGYTFYHRSEGKNFVAKFGNFLEKEFFSKEVSGRKVELDEVTVPAPLLKGPRCRLEGGGVNRRFKIFYGFGYILMRK